MSKCEIVLAFDRIIIASMLYEIVIAMFWINQCLWKHEINSAIQRAASSWLAAYIYVSRLYGPQWLPRTATLKSLTAVSLTSIFCFRTVSGRVWWRLVCCSRHICSYVNSLLSFAVKTRFYFFRLHLYSQYTTGFVLSRV